MEPGFFRQRNPSRFGHLLDADDWLECTKQYASGFSLRQARDVQAIVGAVYEVNIRISGRSEENGVSRCMAGCGVRRRVVFSKIGFGFDDSSRQNSGRYSSN